MSLVLVIPKPLFWLMPIKVILAHSEAFIFWSVIVWSVAYLGIIVRSVAYWVLLLGYPEAFILAHAEFICG